MVFRDINWRGLHAERSESYKVCEIMYNCNIDKISNRYINTYFYYYIAIILLFIYSNLYKTIFYEWTCGY